MKARRRAAHYLVTIAPGRERRSAPPAAGRERRACKGGTCRRSLARPRLRPVFAARQAEADEFYAALTPPELGQDGALVMRQAMAGMLWTKQCYTTTSIGGCGDRGAGREGGPRPPTSQLQLVPHGEPGHHLHARQMGIPLVRRLGPGLSYHRALDGRPRLRQAAARTDAQRELPAPQRSDSGLRVGLRRREPAGPRLGGRLPLQPRAERSTGRGTWSSSSGCSSSCS